MFDELPTPAVLIDRPRLTLNLEAARDRAAVAAVALRPHVKTHRSLEIARRQISLGAAGITCAKPAEAAVFVEAGFDDVRVAYPVVGRDPLDRLARLAQRARISFCVESPEGARLVSERFGAEGEIARVLVKVDCGYGRAGIRWDDESGLAGFVDLLAGLPGLQVVGVLTHAGQAYSPGPPGTDPARILEAHAVDERDRTRRAAAVVRERLGGSPLEVSIGSTPTFWSFRPPEDPGGDPPVSELRPGNYVFHDLTQVDLGACSLDQCALSVLTTVISRRPRNGRTHLLVDAGKKTFTSDRRGALSGYGRALAATPPGSSAELVGDVELHTLSEEHGWVDAPSDCSWRVGDRIRFAVNHSCVVASTQRVLYEVEGDHVVGTIEVSAGGCST